MSDVQNNLQRWLKSKNLSKKIKDEIRAMSQAEVDDAFFTTLSFGTAGMRGVLGWGTNRLNIFTLRKACVGFALYVLDNVSGAAERGVVIARDNRHQGYEFQEECVKVLNAYGIKAYVFNSLRPTPELSFAVRYFEAAGGIMLTASHNPKEYNGFKVYDEFGCQLVPYKANRLLSIISNLPEEIDIKVPKGKSKQRIKAKTKIDNDYLKLVRKIQLRPKMEKKDFKIVFTPQHGTSYVNAMKLFEQLGYQVYPVMSQIAPDPDFSGTISPNPEDPRSFIKSIEYAKQIEAQLIVMTDPDGDRVGLAFLNKSGEYCLVNGNISAAILLDYILQSRKEKTKTLRGSVVYSTIVSSGIGKKICDSYKVEYGAFLTGFKYIGNQIQLDIENNGPKFLFGYEESYGCLLAPFVRDKDGIQAIMMYCEMALYYHHKKMDLDDAYTDLQERMGYYLDTCYSLEFKGAKGAEEMQRIMKKLQSAPIERVGSREVKVYEDYKNLISYNISKRCSESIISDTSDVIRIVFKDGCSICVRPSGTEPKCKFYIGITAATKNDTLNKDVELFEELKKILGIY